MREIFFGERVGVGKNVPEHSARCCNVQVGIWHHRVTNSEHVAELFCTKLTEGRCLV